MKQLPNALAALALVAANLLPLVGVLWLGWNAGMIMLLYWAENVVIGAYNVLKMALVRVEPPLANLQKLFLVPFFCLHYGGFCAGHGLFLLFFLKLGGPGAILQGLGAPGPLVFVDMLCHVVAAVWRSHPPGMAWCVLALVISHGISFMSNFLLGKEYASLSLEQLMGQPYGRVVLLHVTLIFGAVPVMLLGSPAGLVVTLVAFKIAMDLYFHRRSHRAAGGAALPTDKERLEAAVAGGRQGD